MNRMWIPSLVIWAGIAASPMSARADTSRVEAQLSPDRLDLLDKRGYFTPAFKKAVHDLVDARKEVVDAKVEQKKLEDELPDLEKQVRDAEDKVKDARKQFDALNHVDETEFVELQKKMGDTTVTLEEQRILAQAYVWGYPTSPHQADAQKDLADVQKKIADAAQAAADAEAAKVAAHAKLVQRAIAKDLNIGEWRDLLLTMSKEDIAKFLGEPKAGDADNWSYSGGYTEDAITHQKVGLVVTFSGGRVINVTEASH
jgi:flagellar hook-length control protein FliK